ncbi:hypothetical protein CMV_012318 [Castanea mollissima]|uniref:Uncharacterized protein n=1 Tax=Castanea mollissima TaxID=60419 RepID=A0A8J4R9Q0_9ROSI|nr:hypothetical protein CMV_012318 [Castanea mollissima]
MRLRLSLREIEIETDLSEAEFERDQFGGNSLFDALFTNSIHVMREHKCDYFEWLDIELCDKGQDIMKGLVRKFLKVSQESQHLEEMNEMKDFIIGNTEKTIKRLGEENNAEK